MKLLFLTEFYPQDEDLDFTGGVEARVYYVSRLAKKDFKVKVITSSSRHIPATPLSIVSRLWYMGKSFWQALTTDFDLIEGSHAVAWVPDVLGKHWFDFGTAVGLVGLVAEKIYLKLPWTRVIALSRSTRDKLIKAGIKPKLISVVHAGIDLKEFE